MSELAALRNKRGRIRCIGEDGYWRDCGEWAVKWIYAWCHWTGEEQYMPYCAHHAWGIHGEGNET